jgi:hypothetical protein
MNKVKLTNKDWDLIKDSLKEVYTDEADELLDKINNLSDVDDDDDYHYQEELYLKELNWNYVQLFPSAGMSKELDEDFFKNKTLLVTSLNDSYDGTIYYGKLKGYYIYIHLDDHPGSSGYDCCGYIRLTYSDDIFD